ncbi:hypothetical protein BDN71DRAFT_1441209 [Pleurotus eryngii]|uniref:HTH APSES-type domain-containing protein n=1 Tax=Pleurotus eryngii TaxID=5323 RepID=A0A9P6DIY6_PLEER|nr:hypothetical protein BDN71DRAFT_1441209 [Pleurotus eryngii]
MTRPPLPSQHANPYIQALLNTGVPDVKYQILSCQGNDILVGRLKISTPTSSGHAFILRRYDTGAVSLTTMFRAAFPTASEEDEKRETAWIKENYDLSGNNGTQKDPTISRLAGTWVDPELAKEVARDYRISDMIANVIEAKPDPNGNYRRSGGGGGNKGPITVNLAKQPPSSIKPPSRTAFPSPSKATLPAPKRRKELSPVPVSSPPPETPRQVRRSGRTRSPAPKPSSIPVPLTSIKTPKKVTRVGPAVTPGGSDETAVDEDGDGATTAIAMTELHDEDIASQKQMIADMKARRDAVQASPLEDAMNEDRVKDEDDESSDEGESPKETAQPLKRSREDEELKFDFKEPKAESEVTERAIATNRRVSGFRLEPQQKSFAWGMAAFAVGFGAVTFLPNFF